MTVEVERDSLKRKLETAQNDGEELAKLRRTHDEQRGRLGALESTLERTTTALDAQKRTVRQLEEDLRTKEQRLQDEKRASTIRISHLEMELQGLGVSTS
jgi:flagellar biosynthesis regulator FlaF